MSDQVELIPVAEGNRITVSLNEKVIIGRGSSLGCNEKKISRHHAELTLKEDRTLWIKPTHANPVFYRALKSKIIQLPKDVERQLNDGDQIGLLPSSFYFRVSIPSDLHSNQQSDTDIDSIHNSESNNKIDHDSIHSKSPVHDLSPTRAVNRSLNSKEGSVFDFDDNNANLEPIIRTPSEDKSSTKTTPKTTAKSASSLANTAEKKKALSPDDSDSKNRKLPKWMLGVSASSSNKPVTNVSTSSWSRNSSNSNGNKAKRNLSFDGDSSGDASNLSDNRSPAAVTTNESKSPGRVLPKISNTRIDNEEMVPSCDSAVPSKTTTPSKKLKNGKKRRPPCQFGVSCYRKNPVHRAENSHPGDSDYDDSKLSHDNDVDDESSEDRPECPFGKSCYRQNPQHKREFKH